MPHIVYYSEIWRNTYRTNLFTLHKRIVRIICRIKASDHTNILFINLTFIKMFDLIEYKISVMMYKVKHKLIPNSIQGSFYSKCFSFTVLGFGMAYVLHQETVQMFSLSTKMHKTSVLDIYI